MLLPLNFDLAGRHCLLIGCGSLATRKARLLSKADTVIDWIIPEDFEPQNDDQQEFSPEQVNTEIEELASLVEESGGSKTTVVIDKLLDAVQVQLDNSALCIVADDGGKVDYEGIFASCERANCPVNVVDQPSLCTFTFPAIIDRNPLSVAIATGGTAPVLARQLREKLEVMLPASLGKLAELASSYRPKVRRDIPDAGQRRRFWEQFFSGVVADQVYAGKNEKAVESVEQLLQSFGDASLDGSSDSRRGEVYLVGAGPGDPELLTLRALRLMQQADVVFYDRLVSESVLERVRRDAERIYVGKQRANHSVEQPKINQLLLQGAQAGKRVLRLKGGDPFIFGRGGEELEHLAAAGVNFQVVPGVTAASGCAAYGGIPLTHRDYAQSVRFVTGHLSKGELDLPWSEFLQPQQTLVFYMGLVGLPVICEKMMAAGRDPKTPAALIQQGTTIDQRVLIGSLSSISAQAVEEKIRAPTITIIGDVVRLQKKLHWFGDQISHSKE